MARLVGYIVPKDVDLGQSVSTAGPNKKWPNKWPNKVGRPTSTQSWPKVDSKSTQRRPKADPQSIQRRANVDPKLTQFVSDNFRLTFRRHAEIKHGRVALARLAGHIVSIFYATCRDQAWTRCHGQTRRLHCAKRCRFGPKCFHGWPKQEMAQQMAQQGRQANVDPKLAQSRFKVNPTSTQSRPTVDPASSQRRSKVDPKSIQSQPNVCPASSQSRPTSDPKSTQSQSNPSSTQRGAKFDPASTQRRPSVEPPVFPRAKPRASNVWPGGRPIVGAWTSRRLMVGAMSAGTFCQSLAKRPN